MWYPDGETGEELCFEFDFEVENSGGRSTTVTGATLYFPNPRLSPRFKYLIRNPRHEVTLDIEKVPVEPGKTAALYAWVSERDPQDGTFEPRRDLDAVLVVTTVDSTSYHRVWLELFDPAEAEPRQVLV
ncbi:hypothetical protein [Natrarchaeobaculum sulfurireducens]|uniref:hypothetical protein n=1 Tax=Natrarchaeobaculum sulfurireducens TaxID=2044521 RepID=UPI000E3BF6CE|nr:hypothetical protein [Natrarchaeobaculum sulfurireducens]